MKYYNYNPDNFSDCSYIFLFGGRSGGKSTSVADYINENYKKNNRKFLRLFRNYTSMKDADKWFKIIDNEIVFDRMTYQKDGKILGNCMTLSTEEYSKGAQYPDTDIIVFDEFVMRDSYRYLENEPEHLMSVVSTVFRHREGQVILLGNNLNEESKYNPYFKFFGFDWDNINPELNTIYKWTAPGFADGAKCALEFIPVAYTDETEIPKMQRVANNDVATTGKFAKDESIITSEFKVKNFWNKVIEYDNYKIAIGFNQKKRYILIGRYPSTHARNRPRLNNNRDKVMFKNSNFYKVIKSRNNNGWKYIFDSGKTKSVWIEIEKAL